MAELWLSDPRLLAQSLSSLPTRFSEKVDATGDCWLWTGKINRGGYGEIRVGAGMKKAHHAAVFLATGDWPPAGAVVCHRCDNPRCVNAQHLFVGTHADNVADRHEKGRTVMNRCPDHLLPRGEQNGGAKLTEPDVREIRASSATGPVMAEKFGVSVKTISRIRRREKWAHVI